MSIRKHLKTGIIEDFFDDTILGVGAKIRSNLIKNSFKSPSNVIKNIKEDIKGKDGNPRKDAAPAPKKMNSGGMACKGKGAAIKGYTYKG